jgi:hypothetical protein
MVHTERQCYNCQEYKVFSFLVAGICNLEQKDDG